MLGILLLYFIGKSFYKLAEIYDKSKWAFAIVGIASYYGGTILGGIIVGVLVAIFDPYADFSELSYSLIAIPFGLLTWWGLYYLLKKQWSKKGVQTNHDVLDEGLFDD